MNETHKPTYNLFLDDERYPSDASPYNWVICRNFNEARAMVVSCFPDHISFDHDLGDVKTGFDFAKWLVEHDMDNDVIDETFTFAVHSMNTIGANNITEYMLGYINDKFGRIGRWASY